MRMTADDRMEASPSDVKNVAALLAGPRSDVGTAIVHVMDDIEVNSTMLKDECKVITSQYSSDKGP
jgi:hypothetical protein